MMETRFISALLLALATVITAEDRCGFLLTAPKVLLPAVDEDLCVTFHHVDSDVNLTVSLLKNGASIYSQSETFRSGNSRCFPYRVPQGLTVGERRLSVKGATADGCVLSGQSPIHIKTATTNFVYIQTDKPIYKPGQTVLFRILSLNLDLKPKDVLVSLVTVEDPSGSRVMQWSNQTTTRGLVSLTFPLATEPTLGVWKLKVNLLGSDQEQTFKVDEYVLPKFEVVVNMPTYVLVNTSQIEGEICAKYTYGKPVKGSAKLKMCVHQVYYRSGERPCALHTAQINGCVKFSVPATNMQLSSNRWSIWGATIAAEATVTESATGVSLNGSASHTKVEQNPIFINLKDGSDSYFKPGFPFHGRGTVTRPDGTPAPGEEILVSVNNHGQTTYTSDDNGHFFYTLPPKKKNVVKYSISARAVAYKPARNRQRGSRGSLMLFEPNTYHEVVSWFSPSGSYLQVHLVKNAVECGGQLRANVSYSTAPNTTFKFYYQIMSRGNIVWSGHKLHHFRHGHGHVDDASSTSHGPRSIRESDPRLLSPPAPEVPELPHIAHFEVVVPVNAEMSPTPKLLVYYVREDRETVADSVPFTVNKCLPNDVSLRASSAKSLPGQQVTFALGADPGSLCALGIVDKSVHLLGGSNKLTKNKIFSSLEDYELDSEHGPFIHDDYCERYFRDQSRPPARRPSLADLEAGRPAPPGLAVLPQRRVRDRRMIYPGGEHYSEYVDSSSAFKASGMVVVSNLAVATRPCEFRPQIYYSMAVFDDGGAPRRRMPAAAGPVARSERVDSPPVAREPEIEASNGEKAQETVVDLRTYFPETWLWQLVDIGSTGQHEIQEDLPHTITEWVGSAFCTNAETGLGISDVMKVKAFQPFFASFTLPYSVIRKEKVPVLVTVFNYLTDCLVVELNLKNERGLRFVGSLRKKRVCVCGSETVSHTYYVIANTIGEVNVTVTAVSVLDEEVCGNELTSTETGARDAVTRPLIVEPEGREDEYSVGAFICPAEGQTEVKHFHLPVPENVVADSVRGFITVIGDVMGSSLSGLEKLLTMPTGCGEQNMIKFAPNIFVLQYLTHTNQLTADVQEKALNFMRVGYQRELSYRHDDGSYSAFGKNDDEGSMWLTAFVVRSFAQARPFITIDDKDLEKSIKWFKSRQLENGCFPSVGRVLHKDMKGGLAGSRAPTALTAYVLIAMLDAGIDVKDKAVQDAMLCLQSQDTTQDTNDVYAAALTAYAYTLYTRQDTKGGLLRDRAINKLSTMAISSDGMMHWGIVREERSEGFICGMHRPVSINVEVTSYALLAYLSDGSTVGIMKSLPIVKWLTAQRNQHGGFASTQDTVLALQALASYASLAYSDGIAMDLSVQGQNIDKRFTINQHNRLLLQSEQVDIPNNLTLSGSGRGCSMFQANVRFNVPVSNNKSATPAFDLRVSLPNRGVGSGKAACKKRSMSVCTRYNGPGEASNMAIVAVKMVSGWIPDKESIRKVKQNSKLGIKRIETDQKWVNFYFDELTSKSKCIKFVIEQEMDVQNAKPAYVEVYDYYDKDLIVKEKYRIKRVCGTKNEIPVLTREEFEKAEAGGVVEQRRIPAEPLFPTVTNITMGTEEECPICLSHVPNNFAVKFCAAGHAYYTDIQRSPPRVLSDVRPAPKRRVLKSVTVALPAGCACSTLTSDTAQKVLILTDAVVESVDGGRSSLHLSANNMVIPAASRGFKRHIKKALRSRGCRV